MTGPAMWIREQEVCDLLDLPAAIAALEDALRLQHRGEAQDMQKTHVAWDSSTLHALGAAVAGAGIVGTKTWAHTPGGAGPLLLLWDAVDGSLRAVVEAFALGQLRTAASAAVATDRLATSGATTFAVLGAGKQALGQIGGVLAVRDIERLVLWSRTHDRAAALADSLKARIPSVDISVAATPAEAVRSADVVTTATRAVQPLLQWNDFAPGAHVNAIGAITPERRELDGSVVRGAGLISTDSVPAARRLAAELDDALSDADWDGVVPLHQLVSEGVSRPEGTSLTLYKAMGIGLADVALGVRVLGQAKGSAHIPQPARVQPRLLRDL